MSYFISAPESTPRMTAAERREQLIRAAIGLFAARGFNGTTTKEIACAAGVTEALIFRHFPTKEALYEAILRWQVENSDVDRWMEQLHELARSRDDRGLFVTLVSRILRFHRENGEFLRLMFHAALDNHELAQDFRERQVRPIFDLLCDYIGARQREGAFGDIDAGAAARALLGMPFYHSVVTNLFNCNMLQISDETAAETFVDVFLTGLRTRRSEERDEH
jgi:TetR/AcrR family transcriptional regulator